MTWRISLGTFDAGATSNGDQILAGKISDNLLSALPPDAAQTLQAA